MALAQGSGFTPKPPKPQVSYGAPSGPYAHPASAPGQMPYGYDPVQAMAPSAIARPKSYMPTPAGVSGADLLALAQRRASGFHRSFGYGTGPEVRGDMANLAMLIPGGGEAGVGGLLSRLMNRFRPAESGLSRVTSYPTGEVTNPQLLGRMGEHADLAEAVLANKSFDQHLAQAKRAEDLKKAPSLADILRGL